ncbi:MAG TPA: DUF2784 family protein [Candidatus Absconditabacterales bacterium]|nr:DUF2784 family protein [Candidatus Absconditabacterales bacterium]HNG96888.1 DUF2784 family protein [Candidatus Absconditabacterales bacterium]
MIAIGIEIFHVLVILFFFWGVWMSFQPEDLQDKYQLWMRIHFVLSSCLIPVQILCAGCPLTAIGNQFLDMADPKREKSFFNGGFIAKLCRKYLGFTPSETIIVIITLLLIMIYFGNKLYLLRNR